MERPALFAHLHGGDFQRRPADRAGCRDQPGAPGTIVSGAPPTLVGYRILIHQPSLANGLGTAEVRDQLRELAEYRPLASRQVSVPAYE